MQASGQKRAFQLFAGHPPLDLVNTLDWRFRDDGPEELLASYDDLLHFAAQAGVLDTKELRRLQHERDTGKANRVLSTVRELREAAADVFYGRLEGRSPAAASLARLESLFKVAHASRTLVNMGDHLGWDWKEPAVETPLWRLALGAEDLLTSNRIGMVRACASPECRWLFLDTSKNHSRRWCEMSICGNRMKARRFKQHQRTSVSA